MNNCTIIKIKTTDQRLLIVQQPILSSGDVGTVRVEYELDSHWEGFTPSGTFYTGDNPKDIYEQVLVDGACVIPWEVLEEDGVLYIGLRGIDSAGLIKTAAPVRYRVEKGSPRGTGTTVDPSPDVYQQILTLLAENSDNAPTINYIESKTVHLGDNVLGEPTLGAGWVKMAGLYTHEAGNTADLTFATGAEEGSVYILEFDTSYTANEFVRVGIGDRYRVLCYQGKTHITVPLMASGGTTLYFTPISDTYAGSIGNITLRKIQESGTEHVLDLYNTSTNNHTQNYGFWNTFIGENVAENAVGSTRSIGIGYFTLNALQGGHRNIGIGTFAMSQMIGGEENVAIGADNMLEVKEAEGCVSIGMGAMYCGASRMNDVAIGKSALRGVVTSETSNNLAIGINSGYKVTTAKNNIFVGNNAGYNLTSGYCNTIIGDGAGKAVTTGYFNTIVGRNANAPAAGRGTVVIGDGAVATKNYQAVIGADNITETLVKGNLVVRGTDGIYRQIVFNADGTCSWTAVS